MNLSLSEARRNDEIISLADSQVLRWIDELNGITDADASARHIKSEIRRLRKEPSSTVNKKRIRQLYADLDAVQFKPDYMCLIIDREKDYHRACDGFSINGVEYKRLLGTNGGIKNETIVFVSARLRPELRKRIDNGRNPERELVPAKLEAYQALTCSASIPVSMPNGVLVVPDCETEFTDNVIYLSDETPGEPVMEPRNDTPICLNASDGFGLILPSLAQRWSEELELDYLVAGLNTRFCWEKGMVFTFDFRDFAESVAHTYIVKDAWGHERDIRDVEIILTTSMVKLWDSYASCEDYLRNCEENHYTFGIAKTSPRELDTQHSLNYQFIQSYDLSDDDIEELIAPTMNEIRDVLYGDYRKTILFLKGLGLNDGNVQKLPDDFIKALMIDPRMLEDPFVQSKVFQAIKNRINKAKVGVLDVHGNYSILSGDPYALCQSMFGLPITGLLKAGEIYNHYWLEVGSERLACFRAPMTCHNNIRAVTVLSDPLASYWYQYMDTVTIFNAWDTATSALNGADFDGDLVFLTDNRVLVDNLRELPTLMCVQRKAEKKVVTEDDLIRSNINSFGNDIGRITNHITSMFEAQSHFEKGSPEYETLAYRIRCGQLMQQNAIDRSKGIIAKPMPREWFDRHAVNQIEDEERRRFYLRIVADKKPYFMRYIYPAVMKDYRTYIDKSDKNSFREFKMSIQELKNLEPEDRTDAQSDFLRYYDNRLPVGIGDCVMNRICRRFEEEFDGYLTRRNGREKFDYGFMRSAEQYTKTQYADVKKLYEDYNTLMQRYAIFARCERVNEYEVASRVTAIRGEFEKNCAIACPNAGALCNIVLDICYTKSSTKRFAWELCGSEIIRNILGKNNWEIQYPSVDPDGDIEYGGSRFSIKTINLKEEQDGDSPE